MTELSLTTRTTLPDPLRLLLAEFPRADWASHGNFDGLVAFWMDRHLDFRRMIADMAAQTEALLDGRLDPEVFAGRLSRQGGRFLEHLHGHHQIEDAHFFPALSLAEPGLAKGFDLLEADHQAIDAHLAGFVTSANGLLKVWQDPVKRAPAAGGFLGAVAGITALLDRHLTDEEELVVPVILRHGPEHFG
jgi:hypothetical protein